jgi:hypothetical protein
MTDFRTLAGSAFGTAFAVMAEAVTYAPRTGLEFRTSAIINPGVELFDDYGVLLDSRIEIELRRNDVPQADRGDVINTGAIKYQLLEPIKEDDFTVRWVAGEYRGQ